MKKEIDFGAKIGREAICQHAWGSVIASWWLIWTVDGIAGLGTINLMGRIQRIQRAKANLLFTSLIPSLFLFESIFGDITIGFYFKYYNYYCFFVIFWLSRQINWRVDAKVMKLYYIIFIFLLFFQYKKL